MNFVLPQRLQALPPYLFVEIDRKKQAALARGVDIVDLGAGDPDLPTPKIILTALHQAADDPANHVYPFGRGHKPLRLAIAAWFEKRFQVRFDPETEVLCLIGSKEGIGHAPLAFVNPGEVVLVPDPGYPSYFAGTVFAGAEPVRLPLLEKNRFLPDLEAIPPAVVQRAKLLFLNYPNNPTAAMADQAFYEKVVAWCKRHGIILAQDMAYSEIYYTSEAPASIFSIPGAKEVAIEFHSFSKTFSMAGWRIGFAVGRKELLDALACVKGNLDSGTVSAIQTAATAALEHAEEIIPPIVEVYRRRRDLFVAGLQKAGFRVETPKATLYVWCPIPGQFDSTTFATRLLEETGVIATPGIGFGAAGEGYIRFSLTSPEDRLCEAVKRIKKIE